MTKQFIVVKTKCKGVELTIRRWFEPNREEFLIDDNFARLNKFKTKQDFIKVMLKDVQGIDYQADNDVWVEFDEHAQKVNRVSVSKIKDRSV